MKKSLRWLVGLLIIVLIAGVYLKRFRPVVTPLPLEQVDAISKKTGLADCFWVGVSSQGTLVSYPDTGASYWMTQIALPAGSSMEFRGEFPHARHVSFNVYDKQGQPLDRLNDFMIEPDAGATNPYRTGARRDSTQRSYSIRLVEANLNAGNSIVEQDKGRPANTLFVPSGKASFRMWMRIYVPDRGLGANGGVALPQPMLKLADGTMLHGEELCRKIVVKEGAVVTAVLPKEGNQSLIALSSQTSAYHPAQPKPSWFAFYNPTYSITPYVLGTNFEWLASVLSTKRKGGFFSTLDNTYMATLIDHRHGDVLVISGKAPKTPQTLTGTPIMGVGDLRYWSLCQYHSLNDPSVESCVYDEQVVQGKSGDFTIAISTATNRPANATEKCGVTWMNWGEAGDGIGNPAGGMLVYRQMLPDEKFKKSLFETRTPGDEAIALGEYFPRTTYTSRSAFEQMGCSD